MDNRSRLFTPTTRSGFEDNDRKIEWLLKSAQKNFEEAIRKDPSYEASYVHLACVYTFMENYEAAIGKINELKSVQLLSANALTMRAIAFFYNQQTDKALRDFTEAQRLNGFGATHNLALAKKGTEFVQNGSEVLEWLEKNAPIIPSISKESPLPPFKEAPINFNIKLSLTTTSTLSGEVTPNELYLESNNKGKVLKINRLSSVKTLAIGSSKTQVQEELGLPTITSPTYWRYDRLGLMVNFELEKVGEFLRYQLK